MKGAVIWALGFFSLIAGANVVNATYLWFNLGPTGTFPPYPLETLIPSMPVYVYLLISVLVTLAFLGATSYRLVTEFSVTDTVNAIDEKTTRIQNIQEAQRKSLEDVRNKVATVDESVERTSSALSKKLSSQGELIKQSVETIDLNQQRISEGVQGRMLIVDKNLNDVKKRLDDQAGLIQGVETNLTNTVRPQLTNIKDALTKLEAREAKTANANAKQRSEIEEVRLRIERLETSLVRPETLLTSQSNVEDVKGIGPNKGAELREIGITTAGDLIMADPRVLAEKLGSSDKTTEKLQGRAHLSMIPGLKEKDLLLLEEIDITDRKNLSSQDPMELSQKINAAFKAELAKGRVTELDRPTIEEIDSWVKFTKT